MKTSREKYREQLIKEGIPEETLLAFEKAADAENEACYAKSKNLTFLQEEWASE